MNRTSSAGPIVARSGPSAGFAGERADWRSRFATLADHHSAGVFVLPAVLVVLALSIFPAIISLYLSLSRFKFEKGGFSLQYVGLFNYKKLLFGSQQFHLLGKLMPISPIGWVLIGAISALLLFWLFQAARRGTDIVGLIGRALVAVALV